MKKTIQLALLLGSLSLSLLHAQSVTYTTFDVPEAAPNSLSVQTSNLSGEIVGNLTDSSGNFEGWVRDTDGNITLLVDPLNTGTPSVSPAYGLNNAGVITGYFYDTATGLYDGFFYNDGKYVTYSVPGQPTGTATVVAGINNGGSFCGVVEQPDMPEQGFVSIKGVVTVFNTFATNNIYTWCFSINDSDTAVGYYQDSSGVNHGWMRDSSGTLTQLDVPGASTVVGTGPTCIGSVAGTIADGINDKGYISGHYWDKSYNEHGFVREPGGAYIHLNVPDAYQTAGGGITNADVVVGHWLTDTSCDSEGYTATVTQ